ncbi:hypothetical protein O0L34_g15736 [Tuta absoluta]|nr:hypothetical protein O0L34_g15736 [Tuta absoluta]
MSVNSAEDDTYSSKTLDVPESPRKKMRLESSGRKGWSLMDRRTDQEVLQEMGVSLLEPDDADSLCEVSAALHPHKAGTKRRHDQENMNPNVNSVTSPKGKGLRSPMKVSSPSPGPSRIKSPRSAEKSRPLQPTDQLTLETTILTDYLIDEETPLAQLTAQATQAYVEGPRSVTSSGGRHSCYTPLGVEEELILSRNFCSEPVGADSFAALSDEMLLSVFRWLPKRTLAHCMLVCKRWHRVACDETLWQRLDLGNKTLSKDALGRVLARKPVIVRLANSEIGEWHPTTAVTSSRIQYLDLSICATDRQTLNSLLHRCPLLKKLSLESVPLGDATCHIIGKCNLLETLNLSMAQGITAEGLTSILEGCQNLQSLNISWTGLSEEALQVLVSSLPTKLQRLNAAGARIMTDDMVATLVERVPRLVELDLSDCSRVSAPAVTSILTLSRLEHLALSRCYLLPPHSLTKLSAMPSLQYLEVWGMLQTASLSALKQALPAIQINQFMFSAVGRPTVGTRRTSIWGLRTRD